MSENANGTTLVVYDELKTRHGVPFSRIGLRKMIARGEFPAPVKIAARRIAWRSDEVEAWKASRERT